MDDLTTRFRGQDALFDKMFERFQQGHAHVKASLVRRSLFMAVAAADARKRRRSPICAKTECKKIDRCDKMKQ